MSTQPYPIVVRSKLTSLAPSVSRALNRNSGCLCFGTDTTDTLPHNGRALIFNTACGSDYIGYIHHPPNNRCYHPMVAKN